MIKILLALVVALSTTNLFAEEKIYIYTSYIDNKGQRVPHKMDCLDSICVISSNSAEQTISLSDVQRDQILKSFQAETKRFEISNSTESGDRSVKVKFQYSTDEKRLGIEQRMPAGQRLKISPELAAVIKTYFPGLDISSIGSPASPSINKMPAPPSMVQ